MEKNLSEVWSEMTGTPSQHFKLSLVAPVPGVQIPALVNARDPRMAASRRADTFLRKNELRPIDLRFDPDIKTRGKYRTHLTTGYQEHVSERIQAACNDSELGNLEEAGAIAFEAKRIVVGINTAFGYRSVLRCDRVILDAGQPITNVDPQGLQRSARSITKRCVAVNDWPAAIAALGSEAVILRDRAFIEPGRFHTHLLAALDLTSVMLVLLAGKCSRPGLDPSLLKHVEHQTLFLRLRFAADLGERLETKQIARFRELGEWLNNPRMRLDTFRGLAIHLLLEDKQNEAAEQLTAAIWLYERAERRSPYTFFSLLKSMCTWSGKAGLSLSVESAFQPFISQYARYPQIGIEGRFRKFVPSFRIRDLWSSQQPVMPPRFATRTSNMWNHPKLLPL